MNCPKCHTHNHHDAQYCNHCGSDLISDYQAVNDRFSITQLSDDMILAIVILFLAGSQLYWAVVPLIWDIWPGLLTIPSSAVSLLFGCIPLFLTQSVKNLKWKKNLSILGVLYLLYTVYEVVRMHFLY